MNSPAIMPEVYYPTIDTMGNYVDKPSNKQMHCGCGSRTLFDGTTKLRQHFKTNIHREWVILLNLEKNNHLSESIKYKSLCTTQQKIIQQQQQKITTYEVSMEQMQTKMRLYREETFINSLD